MYGYISCVSKCCISVLTYFTGVLLNVRIKCAFALTVLIFGVIALAYISFLGIKYAATYTA
jgi:putative effector of murein hydrolase